MISHVQFWSGLEWPFLSVLDDQSGVRTELHVHRAARRDTRRFRRRSSRRVDFANSDAADVERITR